MHLVLVEPEIPGNTGNIARTCAATGAVLHLVKPLGFLLEDKYLKRAGLDYWHLLNVHYHESFDDFLEEYYRQYNHLGIYLATTKGKKAYTEVAYGPDDFLIFGKETIGLSDKILQNFPDRCVRIPILKEARSLNLSNSVAIILYEALRQNGFGGLYK